MNKPDEEIPECTDEELWRSPTKYKYYSDPNKTSGRSTKILILLLKLKISS